MTVMSLSFRIVVKSAKEQDMNIQRGQEKVLREYLRWSQRVSTDDFSESKLTLLNP